MQQPFSRCAAAKALSALLWLCRQWMHLLPRSSCSTQVDVVAGTWSVRDTTAVAAAGLAGALWERRLAREEVVPQASAPVAVTFAPWAVTPGAVVTEGGVSQGWSLEQSAVMWRAISTAPLSPYVDLVCRLHEPRGLQPALGVRALS